MDEPGVFSLELALRHLESTTLPDFMGSVDGSGALRTQQQQHEAAESSLMIPQAAPAAALTGNMQVQSTQGAFQGIATAVPSLHAAQQQLTQLRPDQEPEASEVAAEDEADVSEEELQDGCIFCGVMGSDELCGPLKRSDINGVPVNVHHLCALWAPQVYQREGSKQYINLGEEYNRATQRVCTACGYTGAAIGCTDPGCKCAYHLPCAITTPNVFLDVDAFELWCPVHADQDEDDNSGNYGSMHTSARGRGVRATAVSRRQRNSQGEGTRARTDWQKREENTWVKVVPPWWAEHKTVHFASKVYKELFKCAPSVVVVDSSGTERVCTVQSESRNDARQQYTLRGRFWEFWETNGVQAGDTLTFRQDPATGKFNVLRYTGTTAQGPTVAEQASVLSAPAETTASIRVKQDPETSTRGVSQQGSHPNRWMELNDGWCIKTVYKSTIAHQQCPVAGWLFKKLYGRLPSESDKAVMTDPDLNQEFRFDVNFIGAANVHYITGRNFGAWMRESGLRAQEQIRVKKEGNRVLIQRVPSDMKVHVDFSNSRGAARSSSRVQQQLNTTPPSSGGAAGGSTQDGRGGTASAADDPMLEALDSLAAAAGFAAVHGTPAIAAALAAPPAGAAAAAAAAVAAAGMALRTQQQAAAAVAAQAMAMTQQLQAGAVAELQPQGSEGGCEGGDTSVALGKRRRTSTVNDSALQAAQPENHHVIPTLWPSTYPSLHTMLSKQQGFPLPFSPEDWEPTHPHMQMYSALLRMVGKHDWNKEEQETVLKFRARFGCLDEVGREVTFFNMHQHQADRSKVLTILNAIATFGGT